MTKMNGESFRLYQTHGVVFRLIVFHVVTHYNYNGCQLHPLLSSCSSLSPQIDFSM